MSGLSDEHVVIEIRRVSEKDWEAVRPVRLRALADAPTAFGTSLEQARARTDEQWRNNVADLTDPDRSATWLAFDRDQPVGMVAAVRDREVATRAWLISMWIAPEARRQGLGQRVIQGVIDWATLLNMTALHLHVTDGNVAAHRLYTRMGFVETGETMPHPRVDGLVEIEMRRSLETSGV